MTDNFEQQFYSWLNQAFENGLPTEINAFCFNLHFPGGYDDVIIGIEVVGFEKYDKDDVDWACGPEEKWEPIQRELPIPISYSTDDYDICLMKMRALIEKFLGLNNLAAKKLKQSEAVGIGYVDGDLTLIWDRENANSISESK
jgi:hypothetical protein